jgi:hypothetical protein
MGLHGLLRTALFLFLLFTAVKTTNLIAITNCSNPYNYAPRSPYHHKHPHSIGTLYSQPRERGVLHILIGRPCFGFTPTTFTWDLQELFPFPSHTAYRDYDNYGETKRRFQAAVRCTTSERGSQKA